MEFDGLRGHATKAEQSVNVKQVGAATYYFPTWRLEMKVDWAWKNRPYDQYTYSFVEPGCYAPQGVLDRPSYANQYFGDYNGHRVEDGRSYLFVSAGAGREPYRTYLVKAGGVTAAETFMERDVSFEEIERMLEDATTSRPE